jgi:hypothetical protein
MPSEAKAAANLASRSRIKKRKEVIRSPRSIRRLRAAGACRNVRQPVSGRRGAGAETGGGEDPTDGARTEAVSEPGEFAVDTSVTPGGVLLC